MSIQILKTNEANEEYFEGIDQSPINQTLNYHGKEPQKVLPQVRMFAIGKIVTKQP